MVKPAAAPVNAGAVAVWAAQEERTRALQLLRRVEAFAAGA